MTANQAVKTLISAEMACSRRGDQQGARTIRDERMKLQSAMAARNHDQSPEEFLATKAQSIQHHQAEALRVAEMFA